jgi:hypothetical protein
MDKSTSVLLLLVLIFFLGAIIVAILIGTNIIKVSSSSSSTNTTKPPDSSPPANTKPVPTTPPCKTDEICGEGYTRKCKSDGTLDVCSSVCDQKQKPTCLPNQTTQCNVSSKTWTPCSYICSPSTPPTKDILCPQNKSPDTVVYCEPDSRTWQCESACQHLDPVNCASENKILTCVPSKLADDGKNIIPAHYQCIDPPPKICNEVDKTPDLVNNCKKQIGFDVVCRDGKWVCESQCSGGKQCDQQPLCLGKSSGGFVEVCYPKDFMDNTDTTKKLKDEVRTFFIKSYKNLSTIDHVIDERKLTTPDNNCVGGICSVVCVDDDCTTPLAPTVRQDPGPNNYSKCKWSSNYSKDDLEFINNPKGTLQKRADGKYYLISNPSIDNYQPDTNNSNWCFSRDVDASVGIRQYCMRDNICQNGGLMKYNPNQPCGDDSKVECKCPFASDKNHSCGVNGRWVVTDRDEMGHPSNAQFNYDNNCYINNDTSGNRCQFTRHDTCGGNGYPTDGGSCVCDTVTDKSDSSWTHVPNFGSKQFWLGDYNFINAVNPSGEYNGPQGKACGSLPKELQIPKL